MSPGDAVALFAVALVALVVGFLVLETYNAVVALRLRIDKAWANIDVALKQRHDMLPSLVALGMADEGRAALSRAPATLAWIARMVVLPAVVSVGAGMPPRQPIEHARRWATEHRPAVRVT